MAADRNRGSSPTRAGAMAAAPFVIGMIALYNWVIAPHVGYLHAMRQLEPVVERMAGELGQVHGNLDGKLAAMRALQQELDTLRRGLVTQRESRTFIHDLEALVENAGCTMITIHFAREENPPRMEDPNIPVIIEALQGDVTVEGRHDQVVALFRALQERRQKVWVDSCRMDLLDPRSGMLTCQLGLTIYALAPEAGQRTDAVPWHSGSKEK